MKLKHLIIFILLSTTVFGLSISGSKLIIEEDFQPGLVLENSFMVKNGENYVADYFIVNDPLKGADLTPYLTFEPSRLENVQPGEERWFTVKLELPESLDTPGETENWVAVRIDSTASGAIRAMPSVAIRYIIFVLYPYKYLEWSLHQPNMNIDEKIDLGVTVENLGEPTINSAYAEFVITNLGTEEIVTTLRSQTETNILPRETRGLKTKFDTTGLKPGNYKTVASLYWDGEISEKEQEFKIGTKDVKVINFTRLFEYESINKFDIIVESAWNTKIEDLYADIEIHDLEDNKLKDFKSVNIELEPWENKVLEAYFDTTGLKKQEYMAVINLKYEGSTKQSEGVIKIDENINSNVVDEIPGKFKIIDYLTTMNALILLLVVFVILNFVLVFGYMKKKHKREKTVDPSVVEHVKKLKEKYSDEYIKDMMTKKGWAPDKISYILKQAKK